MTSSNLTPTSGQLERSLSQKILALYREQLGHQPSKVTCQIFDQKLTIIIEDSLTPAEQLLAENGQKELAEQVRSSLEEATQLPLEESIEEVLKVKVTDLLSDATIETGRTGIIAILDSSPEVRNPEAICKVKKRKVSQNAGEEEASDE